MRTRPFFFNRPAQMTASPTHWTSRVAYTASLAEARHASAPGMGGDAAPLTTSTAPTSAAAASSEAERPDASVSAQIFDDGVYQPVHEERRRAGLGESGWRSVCGGCVE